MTIVLANTIVIALFYPLLLPDKLWRVWCNLNGRTLLPGTVVLGCWWGGSIFLLIVDEGRLDIMAPYFKTNVLSPS